MKQVKQYTERSDYWNTPTKMYKYYIEEMGYSDYNPEGSKIVPFYANTHLYVNDRVFMNPPFSILSKPEFIRTIKELVRNKNFIILLIPSRTDTKYFHELLNLRPQITFIKGRLKYNDSKNSAPFPSMIMQFIPELLMYTYKRMDNTVYEEYFKRK